MQNSANESRFFELFPGVKADAELHELFDDARILNISVFKKSRKLDIHISSPKLIPASVVTKVENDLSSAFGLDVINIKTKFDTKLSARQVFEQYWDSIVYYINKKVVLSRGILQGSSWEMQDGKIVIRLKTCGSYILKSQKCDSIIEDYLKDCFSISVKIEFMDHTMDELQINNYFEYKEKEEAKIAVESDAAIAAAGGADKKQRRKQTDPAVCIVDTIMGKTFGDGIMPIIEVTPESGCVAVCGDIVNVEFKEIRGERFICSFDITDYKSSVTAKLFVNKDDVDLRREQIKTGIAVKVRGEAQFDKFAKELTIMATDILEIEKQVKMDTAEVKRVELHLHSQMSSMDGVSPVKDLVNRAALWGHKAVAITDHGVVQAYPDAYSAGKKKIKILYGVECYLLDDGIPVVYSPAGQNIGCGVVAFDIETTGLEPSRDKLTEIGAAKIVDGQVTERFNTFVNPGIPIPENIVKLTGITDEMVADAPSIEEALQKFLEFTGDLPVVAHNASFDTGFIRFNARQCGKSFDNTVIDTLQMSRVMLKELSRHKLNIVAKHLGVKLENHHRASDDAEAAGLIFLKCLDKLADKGINTVDDLQKELGGHFDYKKAASYHAILLVKNETGLKNLYKIVSESHLNYFYKKPRVPKALLMKYREGLILGSACEAGELYKAILEKKSDNEINKIAGFYDYLEIQPLGNNQFMINNGTVSGNEELKNINRRIVELGDVLHKPVVATCDVHFLDPQDEAFRRILMAGQGYSDADNQAPLYFRTTDEMLEEFDYIGAEKAYEVVVTNTNLVADMIEDIAPVPEGTFPPKIEGTEEEIRRLAEGKAKEIYGEPLPEVVAQRLEKELNSIIKNGFSVMYLIAQKLVQKSNSDGYLVGSRGSVGSSFVANMSGITEVNSLQPHYICTDKACRYSEFILDGSVECGFDLPEKNCPKCGKPLKKDGYDIPFETFLGFDGDKEPDIDLNFSGDYQAKAHKYTEVLFGEGYVFKAGTIATVADKTAYGYVKNYLDEHNIVVNNAEMNRLVRGCTGIKRTTGQHPGGIMIVPKYKEIYDFSPIQHPADDSESSIITTHFDYHFLHGSILKLDILGHDDPTVIRMLEDLTGVDATQIPIGEKRVMGIFSSTEPLGISPEDINSEVGTFAIPEFGTKFVRQMLVDTKPTEFSELIRISGLSHGTDVWLNNAQELIRNDTCTLSQAICCRDDIMLYLHHAGLSPKTAFKIMEDVRKGKGLKPEYEEVMKENKVPGWYIDSCKKIKYMFPKAHAAAYVMMAFRIAWFKIYYPEAFYATYFTVRADDFDAELMIHGKDRVRNKIHEFERKGNECTTKEKNVLTILEVANEMYARGIKFLPIDLYKSDAVKFQVTPDGIRPPLNALQGLGMAAAQSIIESRRVGEFISIEELRQKSRISKSVIEILRDNGCLGNLPETSQVSFF